MSSSATNVAVAMPKMGISVSEGTIVEWRKQPGDWIEADETIADVTTDKVDVEIPSPTSGRVSAILAEPGTTVPVGEPIAEIDSGARPGEVHPDERGAAPGGATQSSESAVATPAAEESGACDFRPGSPASRPPTSSAPGVGECDRSTFYSPVVRRMAAEHGVNLRLVEGRGIGGRVRKKDLVAYLESHNGGREERRERPLHTESPYQPDPPAATPLEPITPANGGDPVELLGGRRETMTPMRQAIARHMVESRHAAAHCTTIVEVDMSRVMARRTKLKETMARRGVKLTPLAFVARAVVEALAHHPILNSSVEADEIVFHDDVNLAIAVALDDGLIVPVIPKAQRLSLEGLAVAVSDLATRAREKRLDPDEVHGGTFTITNPGQFGAVLATPIINHPQVAILDLEAIVMRPVAVRAGDEYTIAVRPMAYLPMSWDHRALDGAEAARFLSRVKKRLEEWEGE